MPSPIRGNSSRLCCLQQSWLLEPLSAHHYGPGHACNLVGERNGSDLDRPSLHEARKPKSLCAVLPGIPDDCHGACDQQPPQVSIALFGDATEPFLAAS